MFVLDSTQRMKTPYSVSQSGLSRKNVNSIKDIKFIIKSGILFGLDVI